MKNPPAAWTRPADARAFLSKRWDQGIFLHAGIRNESEALFPFKLPCKGPNSTELADQFEDVREWISALKNESRLRIEWRTFTHRILGCQQIPETLWVDRIDDVLAWLGTRQEWRKAVTLFEQTRATQPNLADWLRASPRNILRAIALHEEWPRLLSVVSWLQQNPKPGIYLRQLDLPGVHSKWIETHRKILMDLLDAALPTTAIHANASGSRNLERRYGFCEKPERVRLRFLDVNRAILPQSLGRDLTLTATAFCQLNPPVNQVFITENEINFLAFPDLPDSLILFGAGYGFDKLAGAAWLHNCRLRYWGDIDTHGFAILNQLRSAFPHTESLCMDRDTLLTFETLWGHEPCPTRRDLPGLSPAECELYDDLRTDRLATQIRLEQEHISFAWLTSKL